MPYVPKHQDVAVTLDIYAQRAKAEDPLAASEAYSSIIDEFSCRGWFEEFERSPDSVPPEVGTFLCVLFADNEINNGGFAQYFFNGYGIYADSAVKAYVEIGAPKKAALLAAVMQSFPGGAYPKTVEEYSELVQANDEQLGFLEGDFNDHYCASGESIEELLVSYVRAHFDKFAP